MQCQAKKNLLTKYCYGSDWLLSSHNPNPTFSQFFTIVVLMKQQSLDLLSWQAKESLDSTCIIYSCWKYSLFFCKIFRVCCSASEKASPDRCKMMFPSNALCSYEELPWWFHEWPWKTRQHKTTEWKRAAHTIAPSLWHKCLSVKLGNQAWLHGPWVPARPTLQPCPWQF